MNPLFIPVIGKLFDKIGDLFPSEEAKTEAKIKLLQLEQMGELEEIRLQLSAIVAEAQSTDRWTSRARPSFLYVVYILILMSLPMAIVFAYDPTVAANVTQGFQNWLKAIPGELYALMGVGYLGYTGARTFEKSKGSSQ